MVVLDWENLGEVPYRKFSIYDTLGWGNDTELDDYIVCGAAYGGPIAMIKDEHHTTSSGEAAANGTSKTTIGDATPKLSLYTSAGYKLADIDWIHHKRISGMGWSDREELIVVLEDGNVFVYDILGKLVNNFLLLDLTTSANVLECMFWGDGIVAITTDMQLFVAEGISSMGATILPRKYRMRTGLSVNKPYTSAAIFPPLLSRSGLLEVILGVGDKSIIVVDENGPEDQHMQEKMNAPVTKMAVAPNGRFLACYRRDGVLTVMSTTFTTKVLDFDTKSSTRPQEMIWCGEDAVVMLWPSSGIVMVGPYGDYLNFSYEHAITGIRLISEPDCCRILTSTTCEMLQRVPASTEAIRRIGSTDPAALMYDAMEAFEEGDPKSDENIRSIAATSTLMKEAIHSCIAAASAEFNVTKQQAFMKAASYGKSFCNEADPTEFVEVARRLRVLNEIRRPAVGLPLTMQQFLRLSPDVLVSRLTIRCHHFLALRICDLLKLKNDNVLIHWGCEKIIRLAATTTMTDEAIRDIIRNKLRPYEYTNSGAISNNTTSSSSSSIHRRRRKKISYLEIATAAYSMGRRRLATMILDMVQNPADQVPLLLSMHEDELALQKAVNSEDTDLIYLTLFHLERSRTDLESFYRLVYLHPEAVALLKLFFKHSKVTSTDRSTLHKFLIFSRNYLEAAFIALRMAHQHVDNHEIQMKIMKEAAYLFAQHKDLAVYKSIVDEQMDLLDAQRILDTKLPPGSTTFVNLTLIETIDKLISLTVDTTQQPLGETEVWENEIMKLTKKFKLQEKQLWHVRVQVYCRHGSWMALGKLAAERKSPIGYKPFAIGCIRHKLPALETEKYIDKVVEPEDRYDLYLEVALWKKAADTAAKLKDGARLQEVARLCGKDPQITTYVSELLSKL